MVNLLSSNIFQKERINYAIFILYSIFSVASYLFTIAFIYPNIETLLLVAIVSSFFVSIDFFLVTTYSQDTRFIKGNHFPIYGYFLSLEYWSSFEKIEFYLVFPISLFLFFVSLIWALTPQWYKTTSFHSKELTFLYSNEFTLVEALLFSLLLHLLIFILTRKRVRKFLKID